MGTFHALALPMKLLKLYLVGYFVLCLGAGLALWQAGVLDDIPTIWLAIGIIVAVGSGIMLAVASSPRVTNTTTRVV